MQLADLILLCHVAVILFVLLVPIAVVIWRARAVHWWRARISHLLLTGYVAVQAIFGVECPLTTWESALRRAAGQTVYTQGFIADWLHRLIFFDAQPWVFTLIYLGWFVLVLAGLRWIPLQRRSDS